VLSGRINFESEEAAARGVVEKYYSTPPVAAEHVQFIQQICAGQS
jgi:hypothetical protein